MPIFEYQCRDCGETIEKIQSKPQDDVPCPACGKKAKRSVSLFSGSVASSGGGCGAPGGSGFS